QHAAALWARCRMLSGPERRAGISCARAGAIADLARHEALRGKGYPAARHGRVAAGQSGVPVQGQFWRNAARRVLLRPVATRQRPPCGAADTNLAAGGARGRRLACDPFAAAPAPDLRAKIADARAGDVIRRRIVDVFTASPDAVV